MTPAERAREIADKIISDSENSIASPYDLVDHIAEEILRAEARGYERGVREAAEIAKTCDAGYEIEAILSLLPKKETGE